VIFEQSSSVDSFSGHNVICVLVICSTSRTAWDNNFWLQVDYLQLANAALNVSSYFTCLLYIEIWAEITRFVTQLLLMCSGTNMYELKINQ